MIATSPTVSTAPASPALHSHYASRRASSSYARSPRPSRFDAPQHGNPATSARSPYLLRRDYKDAGTQYSPDGFPPTYHPPPPQTAVPRAAAAPLPSITADEERGEPSAAPVVTEPPEPSLRIAPQPVAPPPTTRPATKTSTDATRLERTQEGASAAPASPAKRARPQGANVKIMPLKYETCDVKDLGVLVSDMLMELVRLNDGFPLKDGQLTRFHSRAPPGISVRDYLNRLIVHATLTPPILLSMVFYVDKLCTMYPSFTISSLTVHRFLITAATVAAKGLSDSFWTNTLYARVGGVSVRELALLELEFLRKLEWRIVPKPETLVDYYKGLVERGEGYVMEREPDPIPASDPLAPDQPPPPGDARPEQTTSS